MRNLLQANIEVLQQLKDLVELLPEKSYVETASFSSSSIGKHVRHVLDHYLAFQAGLPGDLVDYNQRNRNSDVESKPSQALQQLEATMQWLTTATFFDRPLTVRSEISITSSVNCDCNSTLARELCYLINHSIHHLTFAVMLARSKNVELAEGIGLAPATATYLRRVSGS